MTWLWHQPKLHALFFGEVFQNYHRLASTPKRWVPFRLAKLYVICHQDIPENKGMSVPQLPSGDKVVWGRDKLAGCSDPRPQPRQTPPLCCCSVLLRFLCTCPTIMKQPNTFPLSQRKKHALIGAYDSNPLGSLNKAFYETLIFGGRYVARAGRLTSHKNTLPETNSELRPLINTHPKKGQFIFQALILRGYSLC